MVCLQRDIAVICSMSSNHIYASCFSEFVSQWFQMLTQGSHFRKVSQYYRPQRCTGAFFRQEMHRGGWNVMNYIDKKCMEADEMSLCIFHAVLNILSAGLLKNYLSTSNSFKAVYKTAWRWSVSRENCPLVASCQTTTYTLRFWCNKSVNTL